MRETDKQMLADHYLDFYRIAYSVLRNSSDVEDAVQEALTITMSRPLVLHPYEYCVSVLRGECAKILSRNLYVLMEQIPDMAETDSPGKRRVDQLRAMVDELPQRIVELFDLYYAKGMTYHQIAIQKGISESMVKKLIYRGHERLRQQILELEKKELL